MPMAMALNFGAVEPRCFPVRQGKSSGRGSRGLSKRGSPFKPPQPSTHTRSPPESSFWICFIALLNKISTEERLSWQKQVWQQLPQGTAIVSAGGG